MSRHARVLSSSNTLLWTETQVKRSGPLTGPTLPAVPTGPLPHEGGARPLSEMQGQADVRPKGLVFESVCVTPAAFIQSHTHVPAHPRGDTAVAHDPRATGPGRDTAPSPWGLRLGD